MLEVYLVVVFELIEKLSGHLIRHLSIKVAHKSRVLEQLSPEVQVKCSVADVVSQLLQYGIQR